MFTFVALFMKSFFNNIYIVIRTVILIGIVGAAAVFISVYLLLLFPEFQDKVKNVAETELSTLLDTKIDIEKVSFEPFTKVALNDVCIYDKAGDKLLTVEKLAVGVSVYNLVLRKRLVFTYAEVIGLDARLTKATPKSELNAQFIIDVLSPKDKTKPPTKFDLSIYNVVFRKSRISYDVLSEQKKHDKFDKNHIEISDLRADIALPRIKNDDFVVKVKRLSFAEKSGLELKRLTLDLRLNNEEICVANFRTELPHSSVVLRDFVLKINGLNAIGKQIEDINFDINTSNSYVSLSDLQCFVPAFSKLNNAVNVNIQAKGTLKDVKVSTLNVNTNSGRTALVMKGEMSQLLHKDSLSVNLSNIYVTVDGNDVVDMLSGVSKMSNQAQQILRNSGKVTLNGKLSGDLKVAKYNGVVKTSKGDLRLNGRFINKNGRQGFKGKVITENFDLGNLLGKTELLGETAFDLEVNGSRSGNDYNVDAVGHVPYIDLKGYRYNDITADMTVTPTDYDGHLWVNDENFNLAIGGHVSVNGEASSMDVNVRLDSCNLAKTNLWKKHPEHILSLNIDAKAKGNQMDNLNGSLMIKDLSYVDEAGNGVVLPHFELLADNTKKPYEVVIESDVIDGKLVGNYRIDQIVPTLKGIISQAMPSLFDVNQSESKKVDFINDFEYNIQVKPTECTNSILTFFKVPVNLPSPSVLSVDGYVSESDNRFGLGVNVPYLVQKNKLIRNTSVYVGSDSASNRLALDVRTSYPLKKDTMHLSVSGRGVNDRFDAGVKWVVPRETDFHGELDFAVNLLRSNETNKLMTTVDVNPTDMVFNDTVWHVHDSRIGVYNNSVRVNNFKATSDKQFVKINGRTSAESDEKLLVELKDINLDYIFEILQINNVTFGGSATGRIVASELLTKSPKLETEVFHVDKMSYNGSLLGDADLKSFWDNDDKFVAIQAHIKQPNGCASDVDGEIYVTKDSLRFDFNAEKLNVGFMKPFMAAITSDLEGVASGYARLYGKFSTIDLMGKIYAEDLKIKIDFTNVYYWTSDTVNIEPGIISFDDVLIRDRNGNTAKMTGRVEHDSFRSATFDFAVTEAKNFLCYDIPTRMENNWYGTIYGNGSAFLKGAPGLIDITVNMETASNSVFCLELSDEETALEYDFLSFTDVRREEQERLREAERTEEERMLKYYESLRNNTVATTGGDRVVIKINAGVNQLGQLVLVMDPEAGDKVKAIGQGDITLVYDTDAEDPLIVTGVYNIEKGTYNFTLQDIIVKEFLIDTGSKITFEGDPFSAIYVDIAAVYRLTANLLDLDESFGMDKSFNNTNVPVRAIMNLTGNLANPDIKFKLEYPTLTGEAADKVNSIIGTDDMMNRQIIYLLAMNRFYTPEYMGGTNKNNELASVASSTISSQLSNMLGQLSENWRISPNFKSDKGDFSDVEVNLALSSQLLNNRLIINGNFGYRDKMANNTNSNFIGDFDIEWLIKRTGNMRFKTYGYSHFNDQTYTVKNSRTTQGVGLELEYDFDKPFVFWRNKKNKKKAADEQTDTVKQVNATE